MFWWCLVGGYLLLGFSLVQRDLRADPINSVGWVHQPTVGKAVLIALIWPYRPMAQARFDANPPRRIAFGLLGSLLELGSITGVLYGSFYVMGRITHDTLVRCFLAVPILFVAFAFIVPVLSILLIPVTLALAFPLELFFPMKGKVDTKKIAWCRNCQHFRKLKTFEDITSGEWRAATIPPPDRLPCTAPELAASTWAAYFQLDPGRRTLFPKNCPHFASK